MKRLFACLLAGLALVLPVRAEPIRWVDFDVSTESMAYAMQQDIRTAEQEKHLSWIEILALAACRTGGKCPLSAVKKVIHVFGHFVVHDLYESNKVAVFIR